MDKVKFFVGIICLIVFVFCCYRQDPLGIFPFFGAMAFFIDCFNKYDE